MESVKVPTIYEHISRIQPVSVALVTQKLKEQKVRVDGYDEIHRELRPREEQFKTQLLKMGVRHVPFSDPELPTRLKELTAKRAFDLCVVSGEPYYQLLSIAARIRKAGFKKPIYLEITEDEAIKENSRKAAEGNATRLGVDDLLRNLAYLTKAKQRPDQLSFNIASPLVSETIAKPRRLQVRKESAPVAIEASSDLAEPPPRFKAQVMRIIRDTKSARKLKVLYEFKCQLCGVRIELPGGAFYTEVHHLRPLGGDHAGLDVSGNMMVLCPNHHAMFDYRLPRFLSKTSVSISGTIFPFTSRHRIDQASIDYHNAVSEQLSTNRSDNKIAGI